MNKKRWLCLLLACALTLGLSACGEKKGGAGRTEPDEPKGTVEPAPTPEPTPTPAPDPYEAVKTYWPADQLTQAWGPEKPVEHIFFHPVIA